MKKITRKEYSDAKKIILLYEKQVNKDKSQCTYPFKHNGESCQFNTFSCYGCPYLKQYIHINANELEGI